MPAALAATAGSSLTSSPGACTSSARTVWTRLIRLRFLAGSASGTSACGGLTTSPVHSRNPPHEPQKASLSRFWNPHELQTIILVRGPPA